MTTRAKNNIRKPITKLNLHTQLTKGDDHEPTTLTQALKDHKWRRAISKEYDALVKNGTWALVLPDSDQNLARLVAKGFHQRLIIDYQDTFSPVNVYMSQPSGFVDKGNPFIDNDTKVNHFIVILAQQFSIKDLGLLTYFLGMEVVPNKHGLLLSQRQYIMDLLTQTKMQNTKTVLTPIPTNPTFMLTSGSSLSDATEYHQAVGSLQYLLITRPDIAFVVNKLSQYMHCPTTHIGAFTVDYDLQLYKDSTLNLHAFSNTSLGLQAFSNANWRDDKDIFAQLVLTLFILVKI
ncbi:hypothetical protein AAG906_018402 [Vitis piasezkii]